MVRELKLQVQNLRIKKNLRPLSVIIFVGHPILSNTIHINTFVCNQTCAHYLPEHPVFTKSLTTSFMLMDVSERPTSRLLKECAGVLTIYFYV
jgi:hypothetical protein